MCWIECSPANGLWFLQRYPVSPRYAKMMALAKHYDCLPHITTIVSALTVKVKAQDLRGSCARQTLKLLTTLFYLCTGLIHQSADR